MSKANFPEKFGNGESVIEKLGTEIESLKGDAEMLKVAKTKPKAIKRSKQRNAVALAASSTIATAAFNQAVLELQGLAFLLRENAHEFFIKKVLGIEHLDI